MAFEDQDNKTDNLEEGYSISPGEDDLVAHVVGSSKDKRKNWKQFWIENSGRKWPEKCQIYNCGKSAEVGAHVYIKYMKGNNFYYILPTCQSCNMDRNTDWGSGNEWCSVKMNALVVATKHMDL